MLPCDSCLCAHVQEMFLEIEQKVAGLSALSLAAAADLQSDELGAVASQQEAAELLSSKLELLKANLVRFQQLLQDRQGEERGVTHREPQEQVRTVCISRDSTTQETIIFLLSYGPSHLSDYFLSHLTRIYFAELEGVCVADSTWCNVAP